MSYSQAFAQIPAWLYFLFGSLFGACVASFLGVVGERVPRRETLGGRSHCVCGAPLRAGANVPVLGWLLAGGRAKCCGAKIPARYVLSEIALALVWGAAACLSPDWVICALAMSFTAALLLWSVWVPASKQ